MHLLLKSKQWRMNEKSTRCGGDRRRGPCERWGGFAGRIFGGGDGDLDERGREAIAWTGGTHREEGGGGVTWREMIGRSV